MKWLRRLSFLLAGLLLAVVLILAAGWFTDQQQGFANPCDRESSYFCLRVVDASVMPTLIGGATHAAAVMIGERGAELIRSDAATSEPSGAP